MTVAVIGLGGMGSAALYHLARRGVPAIGYEQYAPAHARGASHGLTRIIRQAYYEHPSYVPLLKRAYELWDELDREAPEHIWTILGGVTIGASSTPLLSGALEAARKYGVTHELFETRRARVRFSDFRIEPGELALFEPSVGALFPERCVAEHLRKAQVLGAQALFGEPAPPMDEIDADRIILCPGAWARDFADLPIRIERNVQHWFSAPVNPRYIYMVQRKRWPRLLYGFPDLGDGVKAAFHGSGAFIDSPAQHDPDAGDAEISAVRAALDETLAAPASGYLGSDPCMYALSPDEHFIVGPMPGRANTIVAAGFSGHGFKFCSVIGEILADLAVEGTTRHDIALFDPRRFELKKPSSS